VTALFLSRARLRRDVPAVALARILVPEDATARVDASHRLIWALFSDSPDRERDFLWREEEPGRFMLLSARPPTDAHELFDLESKPFEPALSSGDRLGFTLRANPVVARSAGPGLRGKRHDVVMDLRRRRWSRLVGPGSPAKGPRTASAHEAMRRLMVMKGSRSPAPPGTRRRWCSGGWIFPV
jgi:CRISPR system Cascade subunit CasE